MSLVADDEEPPGAAVAPVVDAASASVGRRLAEPSVLSGGSGRSLVLRCADPSGGSVVVKAYPQTVEGLASFACEAAGLEVATGSGLSPDLVACSPAARVVVMADLGSGASMADLLLSARAGAAAADPARTVLLGWASACGRLSAAVAPRRARFDELRCRYLAGSPAEAGVTGLAERVRRVAERVALVGAPVPAGLDAELAEIAAVAAGGAYPVFSPGDICPDNNMLTDGNVRFLDFEDAGFHSVFLDAAYIRMPFSTCWCVFRMPASLAGDVESAYRREVCVVWPELADDGVWQPGVRRAVAAWTMSSMWWLLRRSLAGDAPLDDERTSPTTRQLMRHRWRVLAGELESAGELPALAGLARSLLAGTESWQAPELPLYPALRT